MISMNLHQASAIIGGTLIGKPIQFKGVSTDSRIDCTGRLFIALDGENFNGAEYCQQAIANGAVAVLVNGSQDITVSQIICENSLTALSILAKNWAKQCRAKVIAITGSNGKTTVKNMIKSILSVSNKCSATKGNLNNEIGVPLTLCNININDNYAVIEMGAAKLGDISYLVSLVDIHIAAITNISVAHVGKFGSFENIVHEKGQIISTLAKDDFAILPIDSSHYALWKDKSVSNIVSFGLSSQADVTVSSIKHINLPIAGEHNKLNAACAVAIAQSCKASTSDIKLGLETFVPAPGRLENLGKFNGNIVINDSYNANPKSVKAAIDVLAKYHNPTTLVLGDMAELGKESVQWHKEIGEYAKNNKITNLITIGSNSKQAGIAFAGVTKHFEDINELNKNILSSWDQLGTVLVKGSRSMKLENLIKAITTMEKVA